MRNFRPKCNIKLLVKVAIIGNWNSMQMKWWGDNIEQKLKLIMFSLFKFLAYEHIFTEV